MALVFQYGSNLNLERLNSVDRLNGAVTFECVAETVEGFDLVFDLWSKGNKCAAADILSPGTKQIFGALYAVPDNLIQRETSGNRKSLDEIEGEGFNYQRIFIQLRDGNGRLLPDHIITYVGLPVARKAGIRTSQAYVNHILKGAADHSLPGGCVAYLKQRIRANNPVLQAD